METNRSGNIDSSDHIANRLGEFDRALKSSFMKDILPEDSRRFTLRTPYMIISVKPTTKAVQRLISLMEQFGVAEKDGESVLDCSVNRETLQGEGIIEWESGRYSGGIKNSITLREWLDESESKPESEVEETREEIDRAIAKGI